MYNKYFFHALRSIPFVYSLVYFYGKNQDSIVLHLCLISLSYLRHIPLIKCIIPWPPSHSWLFSKLQFYYRQDCSVGESYTFFSSQ